ncbi:hypothetical protein XaFJ1_GM000752 [Xanthomonas albilineans]|nr:hypothetical protein XaFJ1_GM000752 [Xanthomonas albilineans]
MESLLMLCPASAQTNSTFSRADVPLWIGSAQSLRY